MLKTLKAFGFGERFINWVRIVYTNTKSSVKVNGYKTADFSIERGVRQGCPLSALLYVLCAEVLGIAIRANRNIVGYKHGNNNEHKISQYADDMTVYIRTMASLLELFSLLNKYERATNAKLNVTKTEGLWVGSWRDNKEKPLGIKWTNTSVKFTGVYVGNDRDECSLIGFSEVIDKVKAKFAYWKGKYLSLKGRIQVLNIFILSKVWYCLECQDIPSCINKDLNSIVKDFVWNDLHQRELDVLYRPFEEGGLCLQDPETKSKALRVRWLTQVLQSDQSSIERFLVNSLIGVIMKFNGLKIIFANHNMDNKIAHNFYKIAVKSFRSLKMTYHPKNINSIRRDSIYENVLLLDNNGKCFKAPSRCPAYAPEYFCDLPVTNNPREFRGVFRRLIPSVNLAFMKIKYSDKGKDEYIVKVKDKDLDLLSLSFKDLYAVILDTKNASSKLWIGKWENDTGIQENEWNGVWANVHSKLLNQKVQSSLWETIHRNFMCAYSANIFFRSHLSANYVRLCSRVELISL